MLWFEKAFGAIKVIAMILRMFPHFLVGLAAAATLGGAVATAQPVGEGDAEQGRQTAERLCTSCHVSDSSSSAVVPAGVPTLRTVANKPDQTAERIAGMLIDPHPPMPNTRVTREEINDIVAYLQSLRKPDLKPLRQETAPKAPAKKGPAPT